LDLQAEHLPLWRSYVRSGRRPGHSQYRRQHQYNVLINVLTALAAFRLLSLFGFSTRECVAGTLGLLCATTHLHYAQNMTENNYILLLTLADLPCNTNG